MMVVVLFFCLPLAILIFRLGSLGPLALTLDPAFARCLGFTVFQALLSAAASVTFGLLAAPGYARLKRNRSWVRWVLLFPNLLSPILVILGLLVTFPHFPFGLSGIILGHAYINSGLCAVWIGEKLTELDTIWQPLSTVQGSSTAHYLRWVAFPLLRPTLFAAFVTVFSFCLSSFAIPLLFGGGPQNTTLEVMIYQKLQISGDLSSATQMSMIQSLVQFVVFLFLLRHPLTLKPPIRPLAPPHRTLAWGVPFFVLVLGNILPLFCIFGSSVPQLKNLGPVLSDSSLWQAALNSLVVSVFIFFLTFTALSLMFSPKVKSPIEKIPTLSGVVIGMSAFILLSVFDYSSRLSFLLAVVYGHFLVIFLPVLRLGASTLFEMKTRYGDVARQLGASSLLSMRDVFIPLNFRFLLSSSLLAAVWSLGEFSVSRVLSGEYMTLPVFIAGLLSSYRLEAASLISLLILFATLGSFALLERVVDGSR